MHTEHPACKALSKLRSDSAWSLGMNDSLSLLGLTSMPPSGTQPRQRRGRQTRRASRSPRGSFQQYEDLDGDRQLSDALILVFLDQELMIRGIHQAARVNHVGLLVNVIPDKLRDRHLQPSGVPYPRLPLPAIAHNHDQVGRSSRRSPRHPRGSSRTACQRSPGRGSSTP